MNETAGHPTNIATAPVSFGIFGSAATDHAPRAILKAMAAAGFSGTELGPPGLFGSVDETASLLDDFNISVVGAYAGINFAGPETVFDADVALMQRTCDELVAIGQPGFVILADEGDESTRANPARSNDHAIRWDADQWNLIAARISMLADRVRGLGLTPSFHPHIGTYVENQREVETLLERTTVDLTLDTGHFALGGINPAHAMTDYRARINHVHIKDVRMDGIPPPDITRSMDLDDWWGDISSPLGDGDVDLLAFLGAAHDQGFPWFVIEQDRDPAPPGSLDGISRNEQANRRWLEDALIRARTGSSEPDIQQTRRTT